MGTDIKVPSDLWDGDAQAVITAWLVGNAANVEQGQLLAEVMVEKVQYEIRSPAKGVVTIGKDVDEIVEKGSVIGEVA